MERLCWFFMNGNKESPFTAYQQYLFILEVFINVSGAAMVERRMKLKPGYPDHM